MFSRGHSVAMNAIIWLHRYHMISANCCVMLHVLAFRLDKHCMVVSCFNNMPGC